MKRYVNRPNVTRSTTFRARIAELADTGVIAHMGQDRYDAIKRDDPKPQFISIVVGHEGISGGALVISEGPYGQMNSPENRKRWLAPAIAQLGARLNWDVPCMVEGNHQTDDGEIGEVVSGYTQTGGQGDEAVGIGYTSDAGARARINSGDLNAASIEADVVLAWNEQAQIYDVQDVQCVRRVVLANAAQEKPGFAGAGIIAVVNELMEQKGGSMPEERTPEQIANDPFVKLIIDKAVNDALALQKTQLEAANTDKATMAEKLNAALAKLSAIGVSAHAPAVSAALTQHVNALKISAPEKATMIEALSESIQITDANATAEQIGETVKAAVADEAARVERYRKHFGKPASTGGDFQADKGAVQDGEEEDPFLAANPLTVPAA